SAASAIRTHPPPPASSRLCLRAALPIFAQQPAVGFQLGFTRAAQTNTALLPFQVGPAAHQSGGLVFQLGQFYLQLTFVGTGALGKNIQNQAGTVEYPGL